MTTSSSKHMSAHSPLSSSGHFGPRRLWSTFCAMILILATGVIYILGNEMNLFSDDNQSIHWRNDSTTKPATAYYTFPSTTVGDVVATEAMLASSSTITNATTTTLMHTSTTNITNSTRSGGTIGPRPSLPETSVPTDELLIMPPIPDPNSVYMMKRAFTDDNETHPFVHDEFSRNATLCPPTSQIQVNLKDWTFQSYTFDGSLKTVGGDEFYIYYEDGDGSVSNPQQGTSTTCISFTTDHGDGTYSLKFTTHPYLNASILLQDTGSLHVWLEYSCSIGSIMRPFKDHWKTIGAIVSHWTAASVPRPPMTTFVPPNIDHAIDLGQIRSIMSGGDSVMQHFVSPKYNTFYRKNLSFGKNLRDCLLKRSSQKQFTVVRNRVRNFLKVHKNIGIIVGFAAWELQKPYGNEVEAIPGQPYDDSALISEHLGELRGLILRFRRSFPDVKIFFKTGSYLHLHVVARDKGDAWEKVSRLEYMSHHRTMLLYEKQKEIMRDLNVTILDVMEGSYLMPDRARVPGDAMHYDINANKHMLDWFYPNGVNDSMWSAF